MGKAEARYSATERIGINAVEGIFLEQFDWIFREQPIADMGIDAHVEICEEGTPRGHLLALQVKTGKSYFKTHGEDFVYYISDLHYEYWLSHSLPVFIILHDPDSKLTLWQHVIEGNISETTKGGHKLVIPRANVLDKAAKEHFLEASPSGEASQRGLKLKLHEPLMRSILNGNKVLLEMNEWVHKSLNRGVITIFIQRHDGTEEERLKWPFYHTGPIKEALEKFFPWFDVTVDEDFYEDNFDEWSVRAIYPTLPDPYPYVIHSLEYAEYRLELHLNDLSNSYLTVSDYINCHF